MPTTILSCFHMLLFNTKIGELEVGFPKYEKAFPFTFAEHFLYHHSVTKNCGAPLKIACPFGAQSYNSPPHSNHVTRREYKQTTKMEEGTLEPHMTMLEFSLLCSNKEELIKHLQEKGLLRNVPFICCCHKEMKIVKEDNIDGWRWRCQCKKQKSIRTGSFFFKSKLSLADIYTIIYLLADDISFTGIHYLIGLSAKTLTDWTNFLREICSVDLIKNDYKVGGVGCTVEIRQLLYFWEKSCSELKLTNRILEILQTTTMDGIAP